MRELSNVVERAVPFSDGAVITLGALPDALRAQPSGARVGTAQPDPTGAIRASEPHATDAALTGLPLKDAKEAVIEAFERRYLAELLKKHGIRSREG